MNQAGAGLARLVGHQPRADAVHFSDLVRARILVALEPAFNLPGNITIRLSQVAEAGPCIINCMKLDEILDEAFRKSAHQRRLQVQSRRWCRAEDDPADAFHDIKRRAQHRFIFAIGQGPRHFRIDSVDVRKDAIFTPHIVGGLDLGAKWRASQNHLPRSRSDQVGQIRIALPELLDYERAAQRREARLQEGLQLLRVQLFAGAYGLRVIEQIA